MTGYQGSRRYEIQALILLALASQGVSLVSVLNGRAAGRRAA